MANRDPRIDAYIAKSADFAKPILEHLRGVVHAAYPDIEEGIKWNCPHFMYDGKLVCSMAAFKQHCALHFWHGKDVVGETHHEGMGQFGKITSVKELPSKKELVAYVRKAMALRDAGVTRQRSAPSKKPPLECPADFAALLKKHAAARKHYEAFSPSAQREYVEWITEAKTDATRQKRIATALEWLAEGKHRNWKYQK
ncbi:YdeI/OmpD-associated family protein [Dyella sp. 2HG41-7]|uniref:YdeI/OmpD-associated family protein n=1 Tax=Dyella sp. 2HG41-7 TaxID=2883239 RepID=UPI001F2FB34F|nr:YdeI/OmpD-associated family protein [Dyella sp. 2HG41-7]